MDTLKLICGLIGVVGMGTLGIYMMLRVDGTWGLHVIIFLWLIMTGYSIDGRR